MAAGISYRSIRILQIKEEVEHFNTFVFDEGHRISYKAGQYLTLVHPNNGQEVRRSYSILSSPDLQEPLAIGVKRVENGFFSRLLVDAARPGDVLQTTGAGGLFIFPEAIHSYRQVFFFAAGSGITPILSLIKTALHVYPHLRLVLVYSNASPQKAAYLHTLNELKSLYADRFQLELLFSSAADLFRARLHRDLILLLLKEYAWKEESKTLYYICGPESYMRLCTYTLQETGVDPNRIKRENFVVHDVAKRDLSPPDTNDHTVHIHINNSKHSIPVRYPDAILKAAGKAGLLLPYSCEAGRCGNCVARCISGTVWHSYNEVLTEKDLQQGLILTCVGHPVDGDVIIAI